MASTQDCKTLLDTDPAVRAWGGKGPWKRVSKKNEGVCQDFCIRVFSNKEGTCFVRVRENVSYNTLSVTHIAQTPEALNTASVAASETAVHGGRLCWNKNHDEEAAQKAEQVLQALCAGEELEEGLMEEGGLAVANRMLFAVLGGYDDAMVREQPFSETDEGKAERVGVYIVPDLYWNREEKRIADFPLHLEDYLERFNGESPNDTSDWALETQGIKEAVWGLLDLGFTWDRDLQVSFFTEDWHPEILNSTWILDWMDQGAPGRPSASPKKTP